LAVILAAGVFLRGQAFLGTEVTEPLQGEAAEAYALAQTLSTQDAYQLLAAPFVGGAEPVTDEAFSSFGYPLFLSFFVQPETTPDALEPIVLTQMVLGALAILLVFMLTRRLFDAHWALIAALLTAVSPFLVNAGLYLVDATLLGVALLLFFITAAKIKDRWSMMRTFIAAALLGVVVLIEPSYEFLILLWVLLLFSLSKGMFKVITPLAAIIGFGLVFSILVVQNQNAAETPLPLAPIAESIQQGLPPAADTADGTEAEAAGEVGLGSAFIQLGQRFIADPRGFLRWYFVDKTQTLWSWGEPATADKSFVYPVTETPYAENAGFLTSEEFMRILHGPLVLIGALGALLVWLPFARRRLTPAQLIGLRSISLVLIYATLGHLFGTAAAHFTTPLLPLLFVMALTPLYVVMLPPREAAPAKAKKKGKKEPTMDADASTGEPAAA
jgi:hypothetical protein